MARPRSATVLLLLITLSSLSSWSSARKLRRWQVAGQLAESLEGQAITTAPFFITPSDDSFTPRHAMGIATVRDRLFLWSGDGIRFSIWKDLRVFDTKTMTWEDLSPISIGSVCRETYAMGFTAVGNRLYSFGGSSDSGLVQRLFKVMIPSSQLQNTLCIFDLTEMAWKNAEAVSGVHPAARAGMGFAAVGDAIYVFGGFAGEMRFLNDVHRLDTTKLIWEEKNVAASPSARAFMGLVSVHNLLYLFGGIDVTGNTTNDLYVLDPSLTAWHELTHNVSGSIPSKRAFMGFTAVGSRLYLFGGRETLYWPSVNSLHMLDLALLVWEELSESFRGASIPARSFMGMSSIGNKLYVLGGLLDGADGNADRDLEDLVSGLLNDLHVLDLGAKTATHLSAVTGTPLPRARHSLLAVREKVYLFGGWIYGRASDPVDWNRYSNELIRYDPVRRAWEDLSNSSQGWPPSPRYSYGFASWEEKLFVFGGGTTGRSNGYVNDMYIFDLPTLSWQELKYNLSSAPAARSNMAFAVVRERAFVFGGQNNPWNPAAFFDDFHMLDLSTLTWHDLKGRVTGPQPSGRAYMQFSVVDGDKLCGFGGYGRNRDYYNYLYVFDPGAMEWRELTASTTGTLPVPRGKHAVAVGAGKLFVVGGVGRAGRMNDVHVLDLTSSPMEWEDLSEVTQSTEFLPPSENFGLAYADGTLYHFGGWQETSGTFAWWKESQTFEASWTDTAVLSDLAHVYDGDHLVLEGSIDKRLDLCSGFLPCLLSLSGTDAGVRFEADGQLLCSRLEGCVGLSLRDFAINCSAHRDSPALTVSDGVRLVLSQSSVTGCASTADGAFLSVADGAEAELRVVQLREMQSQGAGGAVLLHSARLRVAASEFRDCAAAKGGGAIAAAGASSMQLGGSVFAGCSTERGGGCVLSLAAETAIEDCAFEDARSVEDGGAVSARGNLHVERTSFRRCVSSSGMGGAVSARGLVDVLAPRPAALTWIASHSVNCSARDGGAVSVEGGQGVLANSSFVANSASGRGGAVAASGEASVSAVSCRFERNAAAVAGGALSMARGSLSLAHVQLLGNEGVQGGGGVYAQEAGVRLEAVAAAQNAAREGGGGVLLWDGAVAPRIEGLDCAGCAEPAGAAACNQAVYGSCVASGSRQPLLVLPPADITVGQEFEVTVTQRDYYNQTIVSDSTSVIEVKATLPSGTELDPSVRVAGSLLQQLSHGVATFRIALHPSFSSWDASSASTTLVRIPILLFASTTVATGAQQAMASAPAVFPVRTGQDVCPPGAVLDLRPNRDAFEGACQRCSPTTYSLSPLTGSLRTPGIPACLPCPAGGICHGGSDVEFVLGEWRVQDGRFVLLHCPETLEKVTRSSVSGAFDHDVQQCRPCWPAEYIVNGTRGHQCQPCPRGLDCSGGVAVRPFLPGSEWAAVDGRWELQRCPAGYAPAHSGEEQQCEPCGIGRECPEGRCRQCRPCRPGAYKDVADAQPCTPCPADTYNPSEGAFSQSNCLACPAGSLTRALVAQPSLANCSCGEGSYPASSPAQPEAFTCQACPESAICRGGRRPVFPAQGVMLSADLLLSQPLAEAELRQLLATALDVDPTLIAVSLQPQLDPQPARADSGTRRQLQTVTAVFTIAPSPTNANVDPSDPAFSAAIASAMEARGASLASNVRVSDSGPGVGEVWESDADGIYRLVGCPRGSLLVNSSVVGQQCDACPATTYSLAPTEGCEDRVCGPRACNPCPAGAVCAGGAAFEPLVADSSWAEALSAQGRTVKRLTRCGGGHVLVRSEARPQGDQCVACPAGTYSLSEAVWSSSSGVVERAERAPALCFPCEKGAACPGGSQVTALDDRWVLPGDLESQGASTGGRVRVYRCESGRCKPGNECVEGFEDVVCGVCAPGYAQSGAGCRRCSETVSEHAVRMRTLAFMLPLFLIVWFFVSWRLLLPQREGRAGAVNRHVERVKPLFDFLHEYVGFIHELKVFISFWQVASSFESNFGVQFDSHIKELWRIGAAFNLDVHKLTPGCIYSGMGFLFRLSLHSLIVVSVVALFVLPCGLLGLLGKHRSEAFQRLSASVWSSVLLWLYVIFPFISVVSVRVQGWRCRTIGGHELLEGDLSQPCPWTRPRSEAFIGTVLATVAFPLGIMLFMIAVLFDFGVPRMARERWGREMVGALLHRLRGLAKLKVGTKIALHVAGAPDTVCFGANGRVSENARTMFAEASDGQRVIKIEQFVQVDYLASAGIRGDGEAELMELLAAFDSDGDGQLECDEFVEMIECMVKEVDVIMSIDDGELCPQRSAAVLHILQHSNLQDSNRGQPPSVSVFGPLLESKWIAKPKSGRSKVNGSSSAVTVRGEPWRLSAAALPPPAAQQVSSAPPQAQLQRKGRELLSAGFFAVWPVLWRMEGVTAAEIFALQRAGPLFRGFAVNFWYYELIEMARKFTMMTLIAFFFDTAHRVAAAFVLQFAYLALHIRCQPFASPSLNWFQTLSLVVQALTIFYTLVLVIDSINDDLPGPSRRAVEGLAIAAHYLMLFGLPLIIGIKAFRRWQRSQRNKKQNRSAAGRRPSSARAREEVRSEQTGSPSCNSPEGLAHDGEDLGAVTEPTPGSPRIVRADNPTISISEVEIKHASDRELLMASDHTAATAAVGFVAPASPMPPTPPAQLAATDGQ